jgi:nicotinate phosphoribosyltransferase
MNETDRQLLTDFYQLTMAYGYWKTGRAQMPAVFQLYFRSNPFQGGYCVVAGLADVIAWLKAFRFSEADLDFLDGMRKTPGGIAFDKAFLDFLRQSRFECDVEALPEGTIAFPNEPIVKVRGPIWQGQWIETILLNIINFQSLVATKAARIVEAARGAEVFEFGMRRAQGNDGALSATRAAYIGGVSGTSNLLASMRHGIPLRGTQAHSWIMAFGSELEAFEKYAESLPDHCSLLVDTYDTIGGVKRAIEVGRKLKAAGKTLRAIRLDSGDFAYLSNEARRLLDQAGLSDTKIIASNELDEYLIQSLHLQQAKIDLWGIGTKLVTAQDQPAMSGVYKLTAVQRGGKWVPTIKVSDVPQKTSNPGLQNVRRYFNASGEMQADLIYLEEEDAGAIRRIHDPVHARRSKALSDDWTSRDLLQRIFTQGKCVAPPANLEQARTQVRQGLASLHPGHKRLENPHAYPVGLSPALDRLKAELIEAHARDRSDS